MLCVALAVTTVIAVAGFMFSLYVYKENEESNGKLELIFKVAKDTCNFSLFVNLNLNFEFVVAQRQEKLKSDEVLVT